MTAFIEEHRGVFGVEPICRVLPIAPSTYHQRALEVRAPERASTRSKTDAALRVEIARLWEENRHLYGARKIWGARKVWHALRREGVDVARCAVERLMKAMGIQGVVRGRRVIATNSDTARPCPDDKVNRQFTAQRPNQLWVSDFTYVPTWSGTVYVAFVIDVFARRIVGWRVSTAMSAQFVLDALDQAIWQRKTFMKNNLIHHSDSQCVPCQRAWAA
jgi:putative transposase